MKVEVFIAFILYHEMINLSRTIFYRREIQNKCRVMQESGINPEGE